MPGPFVPVAFADTVVASVGGSTPKTLHGYTLRETAGSAAVVRLRDGAITGTILETVALNPNESRSEYWSEGITSANGIYMQLLSGAVEGSVRL